MFRNVTKEQRHVLNHPRIRRRIPAPWWRRSECAWSVHWRDLRVNFVSSKGMSRFFSPTVEGESRVWEKFTALAVHAQGHPRALFHIITKESLQNCLFSQIKLHRLVCHRATIVRNIDHQMIRWKKNLEKSWISKMLEGRIDLRYTSRGLSFNHRDRYESGSRHIVFIFADTEHPQVEQSKAIPLPWLRLPHLYFLSRHNAALVRNTFNKDAESIVGGEGRRSCRVGLVIANLLPLLLPLPFLLFLSFSLSPVEIRPSREATRLEESNNTTKRTGRNATGTSASPLLSNLNLYALCEYTRVQNSPTLLKQLSEQLSYLPWNIFFVIFLLPSFFLFSFNTLVFCNSIFQKLRKDTRLPQLDIPKAQKRYKNIVGIRILIKMDLFFNTRWINTRCITRSCQDARRKFSRGRNVWRREA